MTSRAWALRALATGALLALSAAQAAADQVLLVVDTRLNRVMQLSPQDGSVLNANFIVDANSAATYDFQTPRAAIQVDSQIWVSDQSPNINAIYRFDLNGAFLGRIGGNVPGGGLANVRGMRFIDGVVHVVNAAASNGAPGAAIVRYAPDGTLLGSFSTEVTAGIGSSPWDVMAFGNELLVSDGTSRAVQRFTRDGVHLGAFTGALNNIPQQMARTASGNVLLSANGSQPTGSFGLYELTPQGTVERSWTNTPGLGVRGVAELGNGRYLISEAGGNSATRGLGTIDPAGAQNNTNFNLILGNVNGGWVSVAVVPEPGTWALMAAGLGAVALMARRRRPAAAGASA